MRNRTLCSRYTVCLVAVTVAFLLAGMSRRENAPPEETVRKATVEKVIDGDTFILRTGEKVRLIGVDTPELHRKNTPVQYYAEEARIFLKNLIEGKEVSLRSDWQGTDQYGRSLAYVYLEDSIFVNMEIVKQGYGFTYTRYPFEYMDDFRRHQKEARESSRGLWGRDLAAYKLEVIDPQEASNHYGERVIVEGRIVRTYNSGRACFLNFHEDWRNNLSAVIFAQVFHKFPGSPAKFYLNKRVRIIGRIRKYRGAPQIILNDASEIKIID